MIRSIRCIAATLFIVALAGALPAAAQQAADPPTPQGQPAGAAPGAGGAADFPLYVPPDLGAPSARVGGGTRGASDGALPALEVLAPDHVAVTTQQQPSLYWYLSADTTHPLEFSIRKEEALEPLKEVQLPGPHRRGIHALHLAEHGISLDPDTDYRWFISLVPDPDRRSNDVLAGGMIRRRELPSQLGQRLEASSGARTAFVYAEGGVWYDALASISKAIASAPADASLRAQRAALLDQVGLSDAAAFDRAAGK